MIIRPDFPCFGNILDDLTRRPQTWQTVACASLPCIPAGGLVWKHTFLPMILR